MPRRPLHTLSVGLICERWFGVATVAGFAKSNGSSISVRIGSAGRGGWLAARPVAGAHCAVAVRALPAGMPSNMPILALGEVVPYDDRRRVLTQALDAHQLCDDAVDRVVNARAGRANWLLVQIAVALWQSDGVLSRWIVHA
ncbi:MAG: hypothetical protein K6356_09875 [Chloroflexus sp.]